MRINGTYMIFTVLATGGQRVKKRGKKEQGEKDFDRKLVVKEKKRISMAKGEMLKKGTKETERDSRRSTEHGLIRLAINNLGPDI